MWKLNHKKAIIEMMMIKYFISQQLHLKMNLQQGSVNVLKV